MAGKRHLKIADPDSPNFVQQTLFQPNDTAAYNPYPRIVRTDAEIREVIRRGAEEGKIGCDLEFNDNRPTIFGAACRDTAASVRWDDSLASHILEVAANSGAVIVGHSTIGAEKFQFEKKLGRKTDVSLYGCSMIGHHLINGDMTKLAGKEEGEEAGSLGLMGLGTVTALDTDLPHYKDCRGKYCSGPCPTHDVWGYNAIDAWASLEASYKQEAEMSRLGIPHAFYRDCIELTDITVDMERAGLRIDREWVKTMDKRGRDFKDELFPYELIGGKPEYKQFNPKSSQKIIEYCKEKGISLKDTTKGEIAKVLEKAAKKEGITGENIKTLCDALEQAPEISENLDTLYRLYQYKNAGKGVKSWFDEKYYGKDGRIHPRFITTGTCTGRLSSSKPNFQNIGARGWAKELKKAIMPDEGMDFVESDWSQLELRIILYLAGYDVSAVGNDAFNWLVEKAGNAFDKASVMMAMPPRDVAKSVSHGASYLESLQIKTGAELETPRIKHEIEVGARIVYNRETFPQLTKDWTFRGGLVTFTGSNVAERIFGDKSLENRKKVLQIMEGIYFKQFFSIREWQMKVLEQAETGLVKSPSGRVLKLYGTPEDDAKMAVAFLGQGLGGDHARSVILQRKRLEGIIPVLTVHDSVVQQIPKEWSNAKAHQVMESMQKETPLLPGYVNPGKVKRGSNYGDIELI